MAFHSSALLGLAAATPEMWPVMSNAMGAPWRLFGQQKPSTSISRQRERKASEGQTEVTSASSRIELPDCLRDLPTNFSSLMVPRVSSQTSFGIRHTLASMGKGTFAAANPINRRALFPSQTRQMSTGLLQSRFQKPDIRFCGLQNRTLSGATTSLANLEETANKNPNSATSQYAFYQALIRADMPAIVVERHETNKFASNAASDSLYHQALGMMSKSGAPTTNHFGGTNGNHNNSELQAIGQAVAAKSRGANIAVSRVGSNIGGGIKDALHVVVEESIGGTIFKWIKLALYVGVSLYFGLVLVAMVMEIVGSSKKWGVKKDNEAKAEHQNVRFSDVHGCDEAKEELQELVDFLKSPEKFSALGGKLPKGVLLVGPPGTGKTLLARAVAGEAGVPFFFMSGSEFDEIYVGVGAKRVRQLFAAAKAKSPAIVFIDELDAIGGKRNARDAAYVKQTLNQLLTELDGFEQNSGVIILAATNFPELLDKALTRPGRFDRNVVVGLPDVRGRMAILQYHMKKITTSPGVSIEVLAAATPGCSGAELENIINQAAVHASKGKAKAVGMFDFEWARDRVMWGAEKKGMFITQEEKETTAYHEAGHALVVMFTPGFDPLHKITILPRGQTLGVTMHLPKMDKYSLGRDEMLSQLDVFMGGKVAEEIRYGADKVSSGVSGDLQQATKVAYAMVTQFGMSDKLGNVDLASNHSSLSAGTRELIESEVRRLIDEGRERAMKLLLSKRKELDLLAKALIEYETLNKDEAFKVIKGEKLEGKSILPSGPIKVPGRGNVPSIPPIPGSQPPEKPADKGPPAGGVVA